MERIILLLSLITIGRFVAIANQQIQFFTENDSVKEISIDSSSSKQLNGSQIKSDVFDTLKGMSERSLNMLDSIERKSISEETRIFSAEEASNCDSLIKARLKSLSENTEIPLEFSPEVKRYIKAYALENPKKIGRILGKSRYYFPIFEDFLNKYNLPPELKYLAAVESALDPNAVSKSGAVGLWQFLPGSAGLFDLEINAWIDGRRDVFLSTDAACRYLSYLYRIYEDWHLCLASYNGGPGAVKKAIARAEGETNYWKLRPLMSKQMQNYVPAFIAMNYVIAYHKDFGIEEQIPYISLFETDTVKVYNRISFAQMASVLDVSESEIQCLNPVFRQSVIPASNRGHSIVLPQNEIIEFILRFEEIQNTIPDTIGITSDGIYRRKEITVLPGDSFHKIAIRENCTVDKILKWNEIKINHPLTAGEKLYVFIKEKDAEQ